MKSKTMILQGLTWVAWITFIVSLFLPIERHTLSLEVSRFCSGGNVYCGYQNAIYFVLSPLFLVLNLLQAVQTALIYPEMFGTALSLVFALVIHSILGLGQLLVLLAPLWPFKIKRLARRRLHFWALLLGTLSVIAYGLFPDIRMGVDLLGGYYWWALSFLLLLAVSAWMLFTKGFQNENRPVASDT